MGIAWSTVESAIHTWVRTTSGLAAANVLWADQNMPRPAGQYITLRLAGIRSIGTDWTEVEYDAGTEVVTKNLRGQRLATLSIQCFGGTATGTGSPRAVLHNVATKLGLESVFDALVVAGVGISNVGDVRTLTGIVNTTSVEPRASLDVTFFVTSEISETQATGGIIERVEITDRIPDPDHEFAVSVDD